MAHFALLNENNVVINIIKVHNNDVQNLPFSESEVVGLQFLNSINLSGNWKQTSINNNFRVRYAQIDGTYNPDKDVFVNRKVFSAWVFDDTTLDWVPPTPRPTDGDYYWYDDGNGSGYWVKE